MQLIRKKGETIIQTLLLTNRILRRVKDIICLNEFQTHLLRRSVFERLSFYLQQGIE